VHLRDGVREPGAEFRPRRRRLGPARRGAVRADAGAARRRPAAAGMSTYLARLLTRRRVPGHPLHWTDIASYLYLACGVVLMFGPVLWLALSSFRTPAGLVEFPPRLLPVSQVAVTVPGQAEKLPLFRV